MSDETEVLDEIKPLDQPMESLAWFQAWWRALTRPSVATYETIARDPNATSRRAFQWIFIANFVGDLLSISIEYARDSSSMGMNCFFPLGAVVALIITIIYASIVQWIATKRGGIGTYNQLIYAFAASLAPIALLSTAVGFMPLVQYLVFPLFMYGIFLNFLAVKAVHQFGWKKTITSVLIPVTLGGIVIITIIAIVISGILVMQSLSGINDYEGEDYDTLVEALNQRWENDKTIPTSSVGFGTDNPLQYTGVWLVIEFSYTGTCAETKTDSCDHLADEFAQIVFDNYRKVDKLDGIGVVVGKNPHYLSVDPSDIQFQKYLTIEDWRKELSLGK